MLAELQTIDIGDVTLTQSMLMLGVVVMTVVQLFKAVLSYLWPDAPDGIKKPLISLVSVGLSMLIFYTIAEKNWLMGGIIIGLASGGGYEFAKNMKSLVPKKAVVPGAALLMCCMLLTSGCWQQQNPRADLVASQKVFTATVSSLTVLVEADRINDDELKEISIYIGLGQDYLKKWAEAVKAGNDRPDIIQSFQIVLNKLIEYQVLKEGESS